jgi:hypothetical protein
LSATEGRVAALGRPTAAKVDSTAWLSGEGQFVKQPDGEHERLDLMKTISAASQHLKKEIDLGWRANFPIRVAPADEHPARSIQVLECVTKRSRGCMFSEEMTPFWWFCYTF